MRGSAAHGVMDGRVAHDAFADMAAARLELRLDQRNGLGGGTHQRQRWCQHELERDEAHVDDDEVGRVRQARRVELANVGLLERQDLGSGLQPGSSWSRPTSTA